MLNQLITAALFFVFLFAQPVFAGATEYFSDYFSGDLSKWSSVSGGSIVDGKLQFSGAGNAVSGVFSIADNPDAILITGSWGSTSSPMYFSINDAVDATRKVSVGYYWDAVETQYHVSLTDGTYTVDLARNVPLNTAFAIYLDDSKCGFLEDYNLVRGFPYAPSVATGGSNNYYLDLGACAGTGTVFFDRIKVASSVIFAAPEHITDVTAAPEPLSAGLFLLGGMGLAIGKRKKY